MSVPCCYSWLVLHVFCNGLNVFFVNPVTHARVYSPTFDMQQKQLDFLPFHSE